MKRMQVTLARSLAAVLFLLGAPACGGDHGGEPPASPPDARGFVESDPDARGRWLVRDEDPCGTLFIRNDATRVLEQTGPDSYREIAWDSIEPGRTVDVWIEGETVASCPGQGLAAVIVVRDG